MDGYLYLGVPSSADRASYMNKTLPPTPPNKFKRRDGLPNMFPPPRRRPSAGPQDQDHNNNRQELTAKVTELAGKRFSFEPRASKVFHLHPAAIIENDNTQPPPRMTESVELGVKGTKQGLVEPHLRWADSTASSRSVSVYSDPIEEIVDYYGTGGAHEPAWVLSTSPTSPKEPFYLQTGTYSASAAELGYSRRTANESYSQNRPALQHKIKFDPEFDGARGGGHLAKKPMTLEDLPFKESNLSFSQDIWKGRPQKTASDREDISSRAPERSQHGEEYDKLVRSQTPEHLQFRPKQLPIQDRCLSHWSDHTSEDDLVPISTRGLSHIRDSVISHIRTSSPFHNPIAPAEPTQILCGRSGESSITFPPPTATNSPSKRKRVSTSGKHSLKNPLTFSLMHKRANTEGSPLRQESFTQRMSDAFKGFSSTRFNPTSPITNGTSKGLIISAPIPIPSQAEQDIPPISKSRTASEARRPKGKIKYLSNYVRSPNGPDTPLPTANATSQAEMHLDPVLTTRPLLPVGVTSPKLGSSWKSASHSAGLLVNEIGRSSLNISTRLSGTIENLREKAGIKRTKTREEDHREKLMRTIRIVGENDQSPNGKLSQWI